MIDALVETRYGKVRGVDLGEVSVWKGLPFARPPIGPLRFLPPQPPESWSGVREATDYGATAPQNPIELTSALRGSAVSEPTSEDCLYLNVWSPRADNQKRPVMVWVHGGSFSIGSGSQLDYEGTSFATHGDVVVVTLNYRLNVLGFMALAEVRGEAYASAGNSGLLDQIAALQWVQENIEAFGGDPKNVTIFGESAGAMSIGCLLAMPGAKGLFQRAILQSGAAHHVMTSEEAARQTRAFLEILGLGKDDFEKLLTTPVESLLAAFKTLQSQRGALVCFPVIDGQTLLQQPQEALAAGSAKGVAVLIGTNRDESRLFTVSAPESLPDQRRLEKFFGARADEVLAAYTSARADGSEDAARVDILTDHTFRMPAIRLAENQARQGTAVWMYRFDWPTQIFGGLLGACHALEIPFVWDHLEMGNLAKLLGESPPRGLAERMHTAWITFAQTGSPQIDELPEWSRYDLERRATLIFNEECTVVDDPQGVERGFWEGVR